MPSKPHRPSSAGTDRTAFVPPHNGFNVFPNSPIFSVLLRHAHRNRVAIRDVRLGIEKTYAELLADALKLRQAVKTALDPQILRRIEEGEEIFIGVLAAGGYEFAVAVLAVLALGAAAVPMAVGLPVKEAAYFVNKAKQVAILISSDSLPLGKSVADYVNSTDGGNLQPIEILQSGPQRAIKPSEMLISSGKYMDPNAAGIVIFTSGTTGPPKGSVMRHGYISGSAGVVDSITSTDVILHVLPVHHATGLGINFFPFLLSGACIEFRSGSFEAAWIWERWRQGGLTFFSGVPTIYMRMMRYYEQKIAKLPEDLRMEYVKGANQFRAMLCGSSALPRPMQEFWTGLRAGKCILTRYGATEFGAVFKVEADDKEVPKGSVGKVVAGVDVKLSDGDEGEILVKSPSMFSKYLFDDIATAAAHNKDGYFCTGDIGHCEGEYYFIDGRASLDIIKSGGYKISALDVERECLGLPYIAEAMVVGVEDEEFGQRVGAVVSLRDDQSAYSSGPDRRKLLLDDLRKDLTGKLIGYKLPTLLRVIDGELPKSQTGKVLKRVLGPKLFPPRRWHESPEIQVWRSKKLDFKSKL